ncbi:hypothetical protein RFI_28400 [Reticulomyxa filosa]|uniref:Uncharacterized protein n=1 Tax=Reticulomyxa filosa TaxID=46433 RepID=X6M6A0_RETFI|nr:hypothetical protein RFI_28400 [Reticulomyxa filosa]|eukprot:ETO08987.1 hypothetical protein RFI_28400 [Reticulomyxa filosa]
MFDTFCSSSKLSNMFTGHTVRVWDVDNNKQIQSFNGHSSFVYCVKFSSYHYHNHRQNVICSSSHDNTIRFWDFKCNKQLQIFYGHIWGVYCIKFSQFNGGRYIYVLDLVIQQFVYGMLKHQNNYMFSMDTNILFCVLIFRHYKAIITIIIIK